MCRSRIDGRAHRPQFTVMGCSRRCERPRLVWRRRHAAGQDSVNPPEAWPAMRRGLLRCAGWQLAAARRLQPFHAAACTAADRGPCPESAQPAASLRVPPLVPAVRFGKGVALTCPVQGYSASFRVRFPEFECALSESADSVVFFIHISLGLMKPGITVVFHIFL